MRQHCGNCYNNILKRGLGFDSEVCLELGEPGSNQHETASPGLKEVREVDGKGCTLWHPKPKTRGRWSR